MQNNTESKSVLVSVKFPKEKFSKEEASIWCKAHNVVLK